MYNKVTAEDIARLQAIVGHSEVLTGAAINPDYAAFEGTVIVGITANADTNATAFYYTAMNALDYPYFTYEQIIEGLVAEGPADVEGLYAFEYGEPYIFFGVAEDEDGNYTEVWSSKEITFTKAGCSPAEEFFAEGAKQASRLCFNDEPLAKSLVVMF